MLLQIPWARLEIRLSTFKTLRCTKALARQNEPVEQALVFVVLAGIEPATFPV